MHKHSILPLSEIIFKVILFNSIFEFCIFAGSSKNILRIKMDPDKDAEVNKMYALSAVSSKTASIVSLSSTHIAIVPVKKNEQGIFLLTYFPRLE